jgi:hypothetical protein
MKKFAFKTKYSKRFLRDNFGNGFTEKQSEAGTLEFANRTLAWRHARAIMAYSNLSIEPIEIK